MGPVEGLALLVEAEVFTAFFGVSGGAVELGEAEVGGFVRGIAG